VTVIFSAGRCSWRCDGCGVETVPTLGAPAPVGWDDDQHAGGPWHFCPECCLVTGGIDPDDPDDWGSAA
jgi:hypothetical protein